MTAGPTGWAAWLAETEAGAAELERWLLRPVAEEMPQLPPPPADDDAPPAVRARAALVLARLQQLTGAVEEQRNTVRDQLRCLQGPRVQAATAFEMQLGTSLDIAG